MRVLKSQKKVFATVSALTVGILLPLLIAFEPHNSPIVYVVDLFFVIYGLWNLKFYLPSLIEERPLVPIGVSRTFTIFAILPLASIGLMMGFSEDTLLLIPKLFFLKDIAEIQKSLHRKDHLSPLVSRLVPLFFIVAN